MADPSTLPPPSSAVSSGAAPPSPGAGATGATGATPAPAPVAPAKPAAVPNLGTVRPPPTLPSPATPPPPPVAQTPPAVQTPAAKPVAKSNMFSDATLATLKATDQKANDLSGIFNQHNVTDSTQQLELMNRMRGLQSKFSGGNYMDAYQDTMGLIGDLQKQHPNLPAALSPFLEKHSPGSAPTAWNMAQGWHNMIGTPEKFTQLMGGLAPNLLRAAGGMGGMMGPLAMYGMLSGNKSVMGDMKTLFTPRQPMTPEEQMRAAAVAQQAARFGKSAAMKRLAYRLLT